MITFTLCGAQYRRVAAIGIMTSSEGMYSIVVGGSLSKGFEQYSNDISFVREEDPVSHMLKPTNGRIRKNLAVQAGWKEKAIATVLVPSPWRILGSSRGPPRSSLTSTQVCLPPKETVPTEWARRHAVHISTQSASSAKNCTALLLYCIWWYLFTM